MIQYLLNCSAIWLLSLLVYDVFLRRDTFHAYNRIYLLVTLVSGILVPQLSFHAPQRFVGETGVYPSLQQTYELKSELVNATTHMHTRSGQDWTQYFWILYIAGFIFSLGFLLWDIFKIIRMYRRGAKTATDGLWIIETQQAHGPFSFFGFIFLGQKSAYSDKQLSMILAHEKSHNRLWHGLDILLVQLCKVVFWFHPLPYLYLHRMRLLHEYQADHAVAYPLTDYGSFLLEQAFSTHSPSLAHSFFHSPLKKRITMLTRNSTTWSKSKKLLIIPVLAASFLMLTKNAFSDNKRKTEGNKVTYKGNVFEFNEPKDNHIAMTTGPDGKEEKVIFTILPVPVKMNGEPLLNTNEVDRRPQPVDSTGNRLDYSLYEMDDLLAKLDDGTYNVQFSNMVIGKNGKVLFYTFDGLKHTDWKTEPGKPQGPPPTTPPDISNKLNEQIDRIAENMLFYPAIKNGQPVNCVMGVGIGCDMIVTVRNHHADVYTFDEYLIQKDKVAIPQPSEEKIMIQK